MQFVLEQVCNIKDENVKRKLSAFRASLLLFLNIITDIIVIATDWNPDTLYIWLLVFFNFHGCLQLTISIYLRYNSYILSILGFFGVGQVATLFKIWNNIQNNEKYRQWMEVCWIQTTMITIPSIALQIWSMTAFSDVSLESYSSIKILSVSLGIFSIGPTIVSLEKFMNEHAQPTLLTIQKNMEQQKEISNQLMTEIEHNAFISFEDEHENIGNINNNNKNSNINIENVEAMDGSDSDDGFDLDDENVESNTHKTKNDGYVRNQLDPRHSISIPSMNETESQSRYDSYYKLKKPKLQIIQYSNKYYYGFVSLIPSDFVIRVISIGFLQRILFGEDINNLSCLLWYTIIIYFIIWRFTYSENYGDFCWGYQQYDKLQQKLIQKKCAFIIIIIHVLNIIFYNIMPSGYMYYANFHRELYPKILILMNNAIQFILFIIFMYVFNRHLDGHHHEKIIQYDMEDKYEDIVLITWQIVLAVSWLIYIISLYLFYNEGTKQLEEQLETLIPSYEDESPDHEY